MRGSASSAAASQAIAMIARRVGIDRPGMEQIEIGKLACERVGLGQAGGLVLGGEARDAVGLRDGVADRARAQITGARGALALAAIHGDAHAAVALIFQRLHFAQPRCHGQPGLDADTGLGVAGTEPARLGERQRYDILQVLLRVAELAATAGDVRVDMTDLAVVHTAATRAVGCSAHGRR